MDVSIIFLAAVALYTALAAATDVRSRRVPNWLTVPAAGGGLLFHCLLPGGCGAGTALAGGGLGFALLLVPHLLGGSGMGDVKLLAALGAWLGPQLLLVAFAASIITAAFLALAVASYQAAAQRAAMIRHARTDNDAETDEPTAHARIRVLPYAVPVALSTWVVLAWMAVGPAQ